MPKTYSGTFLYSQYSKYEENIIRFLMEGTEIDKDIPEFDDIVYDVKKRKINNSTVKVLQSKKVILMTAEVPLSKPFKVFCAKDLRSKKDEKKIYIDCSGIIEKDKESGRYICSDIDILISYLVEAVHTLVYYIDENRIVNNSKIMTSGAACFSALFTNAVDSIAKISVTPSSKAKCIYLSTLYFVENIMGKDANSDAAQRIAIKLSGLSDREADIVQSVIGSEAFVNIKFFMETLADVLKISKLTVDLLVEKWMFMYGTGTVFALELFPAFASMITDAYVGAYVNNQKMIEKIAGSNMVEFTKQLLLIGAESV